MLFEFVQTAFSIYDLASQELTIEQRPLLGICVT